MCSSDRLDYLGEWYREVLTARDIGVKGQFRTLLGEGHFSMFYMRWPGKTGLFWASPEPVLVVRECVFVDLADHVVIQVANRGHATE